MKRHVGGGMKRLTNRRVLLWFLSAKAVVECENPQSGESVWSERAMPMERRRHAAIDAIQATEGTGMATSSEPKSSQPAEAGAICEIIAPKGGGA